jgi:hypothetical protein
VAEAIKPSVDQQRQPDRGEDRERHQRRLQLDERDQPGRRRAARRRQQQHRAAQPDEGHAERHNDRRQVPEVHQRADRRVDADARDEREHPHGRRVVEPRRADAGAEAHEGADGEVEIVDRDHAELGHRREGERQREVQHQVEAEVADRPRLHDPDRRQQGGERERGEQGPEHARVQGRDLPGCGVRADAR